MAVANLTRCLEEQVSRFDRAVLKDEWATLFMDGVWLKVRRETGMKRVLLLVVYGIRTDGTRQLLAFMRVQGESQSAWEGLLNDLLKRGLTGEALRMVITDGCPGLAAALETVYPRVLHQRCWAHKMRNILAHVKKKDYDAVERSAQAIYLSANRYQAQQAFRRFRARWQATYSGRVKRLEKYLPALLNFFSCPREQRRSLRTTNIIERCFVEVRRRTRPMVTFVNIQSVDRIIYTIFNYFNQKWKNHTLTIFTQAA